MKRSFLTFYQKAIIISYLIVFVTLILWAIAWNETENLNLSENYLKALGQITGLIGIIFMSINYILSARYRFVENIFSGLDKIFRLHMFVGIFSYSIILSHPVLLVLRFNSIDLFDDYFIPFASNTLARNLGITAFWLFTLLILISGLRKLRYDVWKVIHSFIGIPLILGGAHSLLAKGTAANYLPLGIWIGFWIIFGFISYFYKTFLYEQIGPTFKYKITRINTTKELFEFYLEPLNKRLNFEPGQFAFVKFLSNGVVPESHPLTMSSAPNDEYVRFSVKKLGDWCESLSNAKVGDTVIVSGPYGQFSHKYFRSCQKQVWIGGGIGVTPFLSLAKAEIDSNSCDSIYFIYSDNNKEQAIFIDEVHEYANKDHDVHVKIHLSDAEGYLNSDYIKSFAGELKDTIFLLCGPQAMTETIKEQLIAEGVNPRDIIFEYFHFK